MKKIINIIALILILCHNYGHWSLSIEKTNYALIKIASVIENIPSIPSIYITIINLIVVWLYLISILSKEKEKNAHELMWLLSFFLIITTITIWIRWLSLNDATTVWFIVINHPVPIQWKLNYLEGVLINLMKTPSYEKIFEQILDLHNIWEIQEYWEDKILIDRIRTLDREQLNAYAEELINEYAPYEGKIRKYIIFFFKLIYFNSLFELVWYILSIIFP